MDNKLILEVNIQNTGYHYNSYIQNELSKSYEELYTINETIESLNKASISCDKLDYALAASSGILCGIIDIFLVGKPGGSYLGDITDKWFEDRTMDFARLFDWKGASIESAIRFLERKFSIPYDQRGAGDAASFIFNLNPSNHHFKSLGHNPNICGLFFSILDQFCNTSHFISEGELISLNEADGNFELVGNDNLSKIYCGFINWIGHLTSDMSGSSGSSGRGMGIPSPLWTWTNDVIAIKQTLKIKPSKIDLKLNQLALKIYTEGYDTRFQTTQLIPVFINESLVRFLYSMRRIYKMFVEKKSDFTFKELWVECEPFKNPSVKRMLTVAHGTFCLIDLGDATLRGFIEEPGVFNPVEFALRLNVTGIGRFTISLYGEVNRSLKARKDKETLEKEKTIVQDYICGLEELAIKYDDKYLLTFVDDFINNKSCDIAFSKSIELAQKRGVSKDKILDSKEKIDSYFEGN